MIHPSNARLSRFRRAFRPDLWLFTLAAILLLCGCGISRPAATATVPPSDGTSPGSVTPDVSTSPSQSSSPSLPARIGSTHHVADRTEDLTISSPAVGDEVKVRLLLPASYKTDKARRWPVLYLLHGCCDSYVSWSRSTDIAQLTKDSDVLVAMPAGGPVGFYSDWRAGPRWEIFHTNELPRLLAQHYRANTVAAVAGVSMGGLGALDYAARHPGMFTVAASFSGIVHTRLSSDESQGYLGLVQSQGEDPQALWGDPDADLETWKQHNPYDLAPQLNGVRLFISAGNGDPGPLDSADASPDSIESGLAAENQAFADRVRELRLDAHIDLYGPGTHNWNYWQRELHRAWPLISNGLGLH